MLLLSKIKFALALTGIAALTLAACGGNGGSSSEIRLQGAGATFPNPLYQKWLSEYGSTSPSQNSFKNTRRLMEMRRMVTAGLE